MTRDVPLTILMTTDTVGGVWTYCLEMARALRGANVRVVLATMGPGMSAEQAREVAAIDNVTVRTSRWKLEWMPEPWDEVRAAGAWLLDVEARHRPDVVHLNGYVHGALPWRAPVLMVGHSCVLSWWRAVKREDAPAAWDVYRRRVGSGLAAADLVIAPSRAMLSALVEYYGRPRASRVIYNGRDGGTFTTARRKRPLILAAGRLWDEAKNVGALETVAGEVGWRVCVAGDEGDEVHADSRKTNPLGRLVPRELARWMGAASIFCAPARYEPFGLSALEAALSGCALVLGDIASLREVWGDAAVFVAPDDRAGLRRTLSELIQQPARRADMARRARERAATYSPGRMAGAYLAAYRHLAGRRARPAAAEIVSAVAAADPASFTGHPQL